MKNNTFRNGVFSPWGKVIAMALVTQLGILPMMFSQEAAGPGEEQPTELKPVIVTGTYLASEDAAGTLTVTPIELAQPQNVGYPAVADVLRTKAVQYAGGTGVVNPGFGNGGDGSAQVSLRGLPPDATLLLVNGRRTSSSDLNLIPEAAIERIEILNDGASAVYGSDAVAGVVNIILKEEYSGLTLGSYYLNTTETDISDWKVNVLAGTTTEKSKFVASLEYAKANAQMSVDRDRSRPLPFQTSQTSNPGRFVRAGALPPDQIALRWSLVPENTRGLTNAIQIPAGFDPVAVVTVPAGSNRVAFRNYMEQQLNATLPPDSPVRYGNTPPLLPGFAEGFPYGVYTIGYRPHEKYAGYFSAQHKIFDENLEGFMSGYYAANSSMNQLAPSPLSGFVVQPSNYWYQQIFPEAASNGIPMTVAYRPVEAGPRITYTDFEDIHVVTGLRGRIAESSWHWETGFLFDRTEVDETQTGGILTEVYSALLADPTPNAWNPFGYTPIGGTSVVNPQTTVESMVASATTKSIATALGWDARINGDIVKLPGGYLSGAAGIEYRREKLDFEPDYAIQNQAVFPFNQQLPLHAVRDSMGYFGELLIPVVGEDMNIPAVSSLSFSAAARYEDFSDVGDTGVKPRFSFRWQPINKQLTIRGSYAEGFIAPSFWDLYQQPGQDFIEVYNPYTGLREQPENAVLVIGNPNLKPIEAESWMIGCVIEPEALKGLSFAFDYYRIKQDGIPFASAQYIVNQWFNYNPSDPRDPTNPFGPNAGPSPQNPLGAQVELNELDEISQIRNVGPINSGTRLTDGIDVSASYRLETDIGAFTLAGQATRILTFEQEDFPGAGSIDYLGRYWGPGAALSDVSFPEWRANITLTYEYKRWTAALAWNYVSGYEEDPTQQNWQGEDSYSRKVDDYYTFDLRVGFRIPKIEADLMAGINNIFDEPPPLVESSFENAYDRRIGDIRGRMWFVSLTKEF